MPRRPPTFRPSYLPPAQPSSSQRRKDVPYQQLYNSTRWRNVRLLHLMKQPLCQECMRAAPPRVREANTVHHVIPHKGDLALFWDPTNLESACAACHSGIIQARERSEQAQRKKGDNV